MKYELKKSDIIMYMSTQESTDSYQTQSIVLESKGWGKLIQSLDKSKKKKKVNYNSSIHVEIRGESILYLYI